MTSKFFITTLFLMLSLSAFANDVVTRISVTGTQGTAPSVVRGAFLEVREGDSLDEERLTEAVERAKDRLVALGYFESVEIVVVRSKSKPGTVALVAEVTEGFAYRFGGGSAWARAEKVNLGGKAKDIALWLGWNQQAVAWTDRAPGWSGGAWTLIGGNRPQTWTDGNGVVREDHSLGLTARVTQDWGWGWSTAAQLQGGAITDPRYQDLTVQVIPKVEVGWSRGPGGFSPDQGQAVLGEVSSGFPGWVRFHADARGYFRLPGGVKSAFLVAATHQAGQYGPLDAVLLSGIGGVRKAFDPTDLGRGAGWTSVELRWALVTMDLFGFTTLAVEPALVWDLGLAWDRVPSALGWAAGGGLRCYLGAPVWLPIRLELTIDDQNRYRVWAGTSAPF